MTQAAIPLFTRPLVLADLEAVLYEMTVAVNASGIGSAEIPAPPQPLRGSWLASINDFIEAVNDVTAPDTLTPLPHPQNPGNLLALINGTILQINAYQPGGGGYTASAVHFDGDAFLHTASLTASDGDVLSFSLWAIPSTIDNITFVFASDVDGNGTIFFRVGLDQGLNFTVGDTNANHQSSFVAGAGSFTPGVWHNFRGSAQTTGGDDVDLMQLWIDNEKIANENAGTNPAYTMPINGLPFVVAADGQTRGAFDCADLWISASLAAFDAAGDDFVTAGGKPQDPTGFPAGFCLFSGDATGFIVNQGTGGAFTLTGSVTNAATSPSDPTGPQTVDTVTMDNLTFTEGDPSGTVVGAITVTMDPASPAFTGTLTITGADAADFQLSSPTLPSNLETNGSPTAGTYDINIVATQAGISNSPVTTPFVITGSSPFVPFGIGVDFRDTAAFVTDPNASYTAIDGSSFAYPISFGGTTIGWESGFVGGNSRDRDATAYGVRLAGINFTLGALATFRIDLPAPGDYSVQLAVGDENGEAFIRAQIFDDVTLLANINGSTLPDAGWIDANNTTFSSSQPPTVAAANWATANPVNGGGTGARTLTFASTIARITIGDGLTPTGLATIWIENVP